MASLMASISTALSGLQTTSALIQTVSENLASAGTKGYTTKSAVLTTSAAGGANIVSVSSYTRATDDATMKALLSATTENGALSTTDKYMSQVETVLGSTNTTTSTSLADRISAFAAAWTALNAAPDSSTAQTAVVNAGENLANAIQTAANGIEDLNRTINSDIHTTVDQLNSDLNQIANYNKLIASGRASGTPTGDLEDERDQIIQDVSSIMGVTVVAQSNGALSLFTTGGYELVSGSIAKTFSYDGANVVSKDSPSVSLNTTFTGGALQSELNFIDTSAAAETSSVNGIGTIQKMRDMLDSVVNAFTSTTSPFASPAGSTSFATAYNSSGTAANNFFYAGAGVAMNRTNIQVSSTLVANPSTVNTTPSVVAATTAVFNNATGNFQVGKFDAATGTVSNVWKTFTTCSYETLGTGILSYCQTTSSAVSALATTSDSQKSTLESNYANVTGVSTDAELVKLTALQNAYNSSAKVIGTIKAMLDTLQNMF